MRGVSQFQKSDNCCRKFSPLHTSVHFQGQQGAESGNLLKHQTTDRCACADCRYMKMNTLQKLRDCLDTLQPHVEMEESLRKRAELPLLRMLEQSK